MVGKNQAEDLAQEVFIKVDKALKDFKAESSLSTWIYKIATNTALDKIKSRSFKQDSKSVPLEKITTEPQTENIAIEDTSLSAEREAIRNEMTECIREFVDRLPQEYRTVIILSEIKDLKNQQIADILALTLDNVKIRLHRARTRLKAEFEAGCDFYHDQDGDLACDRKKPQN
jgi:RNA polymerase sigma-70 factor (ECF subfamily)